jgi:predicted outer membrane repeat protein
VAAAAQASGVAGTGTAGSCTEAALDTALSGGGAVTFNCGALPVTITLTSTKNVTASTSIDGSSMVTLDGGNSVRLFSVTTTGVTLTLDNIALTHGHTAATYGGAVFITNGALVVNNARFDGNSSGTGGGAIAATGPTASDTSSITISDSLFTSNSTLIGGAIYADSAAVNVSASTFSGNSANYGGAMAFYPGNGTDVVVTTSTFMGNTAQASAGGGAIAIEGTSSLTISNSTFNQNSVTGTGSFNRGGAMALFGPPPGTILNNLTIADNSAQTGGGIFFGNSNPTLENSIVSNNTGGNCSFAASYNDGGNNLQFGDSTCAGVAVADPLLGPLTGNGGTGGATMALSSGSPAIDAGNNATCTPTDERGVARVDGNGDGSLVCDIGAFEFQPAPPPRRVAPAAIPVGGTGWLLFAAILLAVVGVAALRLDRRRR